MQFLSGTKKILQYLDVYKRPPLKLRFVELPSQCIEFFVIVSMTITSVPIGAFCYVNRNNFSVCSAGWLYLTPILTMKCIYTTLLTNRELMTAAIDHIEGVTKSSNFSQRILVINQQQKYIFLNAGIHINDDLMDLYVKRDQKINTLINNLLLGVSYTTMFFFVPNAMPPITHFIFGWPEKMIWNFPFPVVCVKSIETYST